MRRAPLACIALLSLALAPLAADRAAPAARWWKGNTHTHTLWSDGDAAPEQAVDWYREQGYHFLVLSEHNQLARGERWFPVTEEGKGRLTKARIAQLVERFGADSVQVRERTLPGTSGDEMRLATLPELRGRFEREGEFLLVTGEEVTGHFNREVEGQKPVRLPVHINALNIDEYVPPSGGDSPADVMNKALAAIQAEGERAARPVVSHVNHPNYQWGLTWEDLAAMRGGRFFEVHNGHRSVRNEGDEERPSTERMWDLANARRAADPDLPLLFGVATDDTHQYHGAETCPPGRAWVMVRATSLEPDALMRAMLAGDFYGSTGVTLSDVRVEGEQYIIDIDAAEGVAYTTRFIGVRGESGQPEVLLETDADPAIYERTGDELFVRAVVESDRVLEDAYAEGERARCWTQPVPGR